VGVVTESLLADAGYEVSRANDAVEALAGLRKAEFDVLLTDVRMPGAMNGVQLAREAVRRQPKLKVLLCSGWTAESLGGDVAACPWPLLPKPFDEQQLRQALEALKRAEPAG
jgi:CheY-like chemotaxis protein